MRSTALLLSLLLALPASLAAREPVQASPPLAVPGLAEAHLSPGFWIDALADADRVVLTPTQIAAQNARMQAEDPSIHDLEALPARIDGAQVRGWIEALSKLPERELFADTGSPVPPLQGRLSAPRVALPGAMLEDLQIEFDDGSDE